MTVLGWVTFVIISVFIVIAGLAIMYSIDPRHVYLGPMLAAPFIILLFMGMRWYFNSTEAGKRALKTQESNFNGGIHRTVQVYDATGGLIKTYSGTFDVDYDDDRIVFDDENQRPIKKQSKGLKRSGAASLPPTPAGGTAPAAIL